MEKKNKRICCEMVSKSNNGVSYNIEVCGSCIELSSMLIELVKQIQTTLIKDMKVNEINNSFVNTLITSAVAIGLENKN